MPRILISASQCATLIGARTLSDTERKAVKKLTFGAIKSDAGIPSTVKVKVEIDDAGSTDYRVLKDKATGRALMGVDGRYTGIEPAAVSPATVVVQAVSPTVRVIDQGELLDLLRESDAGAEDDEFVLPEHMDLALGGDGSLYFRA